MATAHTVLIPDGSAGISCRTVRFCPVETSTWKTVVGKLIRLVTTWDQYPPATLEANARKRHHPQKQCKSATVRRISNRCRRYAFHRATSEDHKQSNGE